ncbi:MAG TPA: transglycosylase domain-containing protein [Oligoflexia bacterium]|nr:transglycosylase domain-containing protein [Oligoflexia bacterium]HMR23872.1 transglycosylase domain-containing protein [Oligoflexia bacterium]
MNKKIRKQNKRFRLKKNNRIKKSKVHTFKWTLLFIFLVGVLGVFIQTYLSLRLIVNKFSKPLQWEISSQVYSDESVIYSGEYFKKDYITEYLKLLSYKEVKQQKDIAHARFYENKTTNSVLVYFHQPKKKIVFKFNDKQFLDSIVDVSQSLEKELNHIELPRVLLGEFYGDKREKRTILEFGEFPETLKRSIIAMEDRSFYSHHGVSIKGVLRALITNITKKSYAQGGSTLTQQLMKNFFLSHKKTLWRKWKELVLALIVDKMYSKEKIFQMYLNEIYLGQVGTVSIHGFEEASQLYFHDSVKNLSISQQAMLVGLISSPGRYSPFNNFERSLSRRDLVLKKIFDEKIINQKQYINARDEKIYLAKKREVFEQSLSLKNSVLYELNEHFSELDLKENGYKVFTSIDPIFQKSLRIQSQKIYKEILTQQKFNSEDLQMGAISINPTSGAIKAVLTGGGNQNQYNHVYQMRRPIGSLIKPLILAYMVEKYKNDSEKYISNTRLLNDKKTTIKYDEKEWQPKNYANQYFGKVSLRTVVEKSLNSGFLDLIQQYSFEDIYAMAKQYGFTGYQEVPALALGALESNPYQMAGLYSMFVNSGSALTPSLVQKVTNEAESIQSRQLKSKKFISEEVAYQILSLMQGVLKDGTGKSSKAYNLKYSYAGKTGTSNDNRDAWFIGLSKDLITVVWFGLEGDHKSSLTGANSALQIWLNYIKKIETYVRSESFKPAEKIKIKKIDKEKACRWSLFKSKRNNFEEVFLSNYSIRRCSNE